jgi:hypothetical protein
MSQDLEHSPGPADQAVANDYDSIAEAYAAETESNLINGYYTRPAVLDLAGDVTGRRILDVGCGAGPLLAALREHAARARFAPNARPAASSGSSGRRSSKAAGRGAAAARHSPPAASTASR